MQTENRNIENILREFKDTYLKDLQQHQMLLGVFTELGLMRKMCRVHYEQARRFGESSGRNIRIGARIQGLMARMRGPEITVDSLYEEKKRID